MNKLRSIYLFVFLFCFSSPAFGYVGPGMGGGIIAAVLGLIAAFFLAIIAIIFYPVKRFLSKRKNKKN